MKKTTALIFMVAILQCALAVPTDSPVWTGLWSFDGNLADASGHGQDAYADQPVFTSSAEGQALRLTANTVINIPDAPGLRLTHGFRLACRVRLAALPAGNAWATLIMKGGYNAGEYILRVNPASEGHHFGFFVNTGGWEPRVQSREPVQPGVWYELEAGWDAQGIWLTVNGDTTRIARSGVPFATRAPLHLGAFDGEIDDLKIASPGSNRTGVAGWPFEGDLRDATGHGYDLKGPDSTFVPVPGGQALQADAGRLAVDSTPDLQLAPGLRLDCSVFFNEIPAGTTPILIKDGEYQLRLDPQSEGGNLSFFVNLNGWEPRVRSKSRIESGRWYHITALWDGLAIALDINGEHIEIPRSGHAKPGSSSLVLGKFNGLLDNVRIENPKPDVVRLQDLSVENTLLRAGRSERLSGIVRNFGNAVSSCTLALELPKGVLCESPATLDLGALAAGSEKPVQWRIRAAAATSAVAISRVATSSATTNVTRKLLAFLPATDPDRSARTWNPPVVTTDIQSVTYYVDSIHGDNAGAGTTPESAWRDFTPINGRTLGPGDRLLIRRGSVINQELQISARGTAEAWAEIGTYGEGPRPIIRRNGDIDDRCILIKAPDYLHIRGLVICHAGKGLIVHYPNGGHRGLLIEDCIAHHIEGLYRHNSHGIPEWQDRHGAPGDNMNSAGFAVSGSLAEDLVLRDCEMFQCSWGFRFSGDNVTIDRIFCHDNYAHNTSPHPAVTSIRRSYLLNSIFDAPGWHAHAGTMGIMICDPIGLVIRNCHFLNQPDSGSHDEGGIDFEARGEGCLVDRCTFRNNAGAAIEMLGLRSPQARNIEIVGSRFDRNNVANKLGPSEIFIWGSRDPEVCCSTGVIRNNGYVLNPGVVFFTNQAPALTQWTLTNNTQYVSGQALDAAMPLNNPPAVNAGEEIWSDQGSVHLAGAVSDDGKPAASNPAVLWEVLEGPGDVQFSNPAAPATAAHFSMPGDYRLRLKADDGDLWRSSHTAVHILPSGSSVASAWSFSRPLDKEGWSDWNLGTKEMAFPESESVAKPVRLVAGGNYILAIKDAPDAHLLSPDELKVDLDANGIIAIRFQNHTPATRMHIRFTTEAAPRWEANLGQPFDVIPDDNEARLYSVDMRSAGGWSGKLKQLRLSFADGTPLTGTCRVDYIWIGQQPFPR